LQIERKEKAAAQLQDDLTRSRDKIEKLFKTIDELQQSESAAQLQAKRAERECRETKEQKLRLERENEGWKSTAAGLGVGRPGSVIGSKRVGSGGWKGSEYGEGGVDIPKRKSSLSRQFSMSKGFL
jgi:myosin protein heavy chain